MAETNGEFRQVLFEAVDEGLLVLGESGRNAVYFHLHNLFSVKKEDILEKTEVFVESLRKIFGVGAEVIERAIIRSLYCKLGLCFEEKNNSNFCACLDVAKHMVNQK